MDHNTNMVGYASARTAGELKYRNSFGAFNKTMFG